MKYAKCDVCGKKHQYTKTVKIKHQGRVITTKEVHSPCLDEIARLAVGALNSKL